MAILVAQGGNTGGGGLGDLCLRYRFAALAAMARWGSSVSNSGDGGGGVTSNAVSVRTSLPALMPTTCR